MHFGTYGLQAGQAVPSLHLERQAGFCLPASDDQRTDASPRALLRILIVDDNELFSSALRRVLVRQGHDCTVVDCLEDAAEAVRVNTFDVVLSDVHLSGGSADDLIKSVDALSPRTISISVSGDSPDGHEDEAPASRCGLMKPFSLDDLFAIVDRRAA